MAAIIASAKTVPRASSSALLAGALLGRSIDTRGDRTVGTLLGAALGGVLGREIDRGGARCR